MVRNIFMGTGNFNEKIEGDYVETKVTQVNSNGVETTITSQSSQKRKGKTGNTGIGHMSGGTISGNATVTGSINIKDNNLEGSGNKIEVNSNASASSQNISIPDRQTNDTEDSSLEAGDKIAGFIEKAVQLIIKNDGEELSIGESVHIAGHVLTDLEDAKNWRTLLSMVNNPTGVKLYLRGRLGNKYKLVIDTILYHVCGPEVI